MTAIVFRSLSRQISLFLYDIWRMENIRATHSRYSFQKFLGQTSTEPVALDIVRAEGCYLYGRDGKRYLDLIGGISVGNVGHRHPAVVEAIKRQADDYLHIMVYGELIQSPQVEYAKLLVENLPPSLNNVFFTASGSEATEGAMKLAKRASGRTKIIAFNKSYHGSTQGSLSIMGDEYWRNAFRPLLPGISHLDYNNFDEIDEIDTDTACVIAETIQAEAGVIVPAEGWLKALRKKCTETGTLLVLDEIQCGFGRNGSLWAFQRFDVVPDILLLGKALGGGMPLGAFIADQKLMITLTDDPVLGHINTFGGHPVSCAAGMAAMKVLLNEDLIEEVHAKEKLFTKLLTHKRIKAIRSAGLMMAVQLESAEITRRLINRLINQEIFTDWFLFAPDCLRIVPPLNIEHSQIEHACEVITTTLGEM
jgi:acetylornithine/N-succinyldiaminopimelate aminotransferase